MLIRKLFDHETLNSECGRLFYLDYVFIIRLPSEALPAMRAGYRERLLTRDNLPRQSGRAFALFLTVTSHGPQIPYSQTHEGMCDSSATCFRDSDILAAHGTCPIRDLWWVIRDSTPRGEPLSPSLLKRNINRMIKGALTTMGVAGAHSYPAHSFRGGTSMELKRRDPTLDQVLKTVG